MCSSDATVVSDCFPSSTSSAKNCWPTGINDWIFLFQVHSEAQSCPRTFWKLKCVRICEENRRLLLAFLYLRKIDTKADHKKRQADNNEFIRFQMVICMNTSGEFPELLKVSLSWSRPQRAKNRHISGPNGGYFVYHPSNVFCKLAEKNVYRYS